MVDNRDEAGQTPNAPSFGRASWVCNVIDTRQSYLQKLLKQALGALGYHEQAAHSVHYAYEMVALSHATARELGTRSMPKPIARLSRSQDARARASKLTIFSTGSSTRLLAKSRNAILSCPPSRSG